MKLPWVSRAEHDALEAYVKRLEDRIMTLENAGTIRAKQAESIGKPQLVRRFNWRRATNEFEQRVAQEALRDDSVTDA